MAGVNGQSFGFLNTTGQVCLGHINALQSCGTKSVTSLRLRAAADVNQCFDSVLANYSGGIISISPPEAPVRIPTTNETCGFPDFITLLEYACVDDLYSLGESRDSENGKLGKEAVEDYRACQKQAAIQYVRCTFQKPIDQVSDCVIENARKVDWVFHVQEYTGAVKCPNIHGILAALAFSIILSVTAAVLLYFSRRWQVRRKPVKGLPLPHVCLRLAYAYGEKSAAEYRMPHNTEGMEIYYASPFRLAQRYTLKETFVFQLMIREVLTAFLAALIFGTSTKSLDFLWVSVLYLVRPRAAPFIGALGIFALWAEQGIAELVLDVALSVGAGTAVVFKFLARGESHGSFLVLPHNPAEPAHEVRAMQVGGQLAIFPMYVLVVISVLFGIWFWSGRCKVPVRRRKTWIVIFIFGFTPVWLYCVLSPIFAIPVLAVAVLEKVRRRKGIDVRNPCWGAKQTASWHALASFDATLFRLLYRLLLLCSLIINVGNWMFFTNYLRLEGELFCPSRVPSVLALWALFPLAVDLLFGLIRVLTGTDGPFTLPGDPGIVVGRSPVRRAYLGNPNVFGGGRPRFSLVPGGRSG